MQGNESIRIVKHEESLRSVQHRGVRMRVLYEDERLEIVNSEMEPHSSLEFDYSVDFSAFHLVLEGSPLLEGKDRIEALLPGDSVYLPDGTGHRISNPASSRSVIWTLLEKKERHSNGGGL